MRLRTSLSLLVVASVIPLAGFGLVVSTVLVEHEQDNFVSAVQARNRAFMSAVDSQLQGYVGVLRALGASRALSEHDFRAFHQHLSRILPTQHDWLNVVLLDAHGRHLVNPMVPFGSPLQEKPQQPASVEQVVRTMKPTVGDVIEKGTVTQRTGIPVRVPVIEGGEVRYVLTAIIKPEAFERLIHEQQVPSNWVSGLVDRTGKFIARVPPMPPGSMASEPFLQHARAADEGWYRGPTVEGLDTFTAFAHAPFSGWMVGFAIPAEAVLAGAHRAAWLMAGGIALSLLSALVFGLWLARRIARPITRLAQAAPVLGTDQVAMPPDAGDIDEVRDLARALVQADQVIRERRERGEREREALRASDREKEEFLAMLSHELRNPLGALVMAARLLRDSPPGSEAYHRAQEVLDRQTRQMTRLVEDLLDVSRLAMGKVSLELERLDLAQLATSIVETWRNGPRLARHPVELHTQTAWVNADRARLEQVISNLLDNALKFTPAGRGITVEVTRDDANARLVVADEGRGIEAADLERIFLPFVQARQDASRTEGGLGVGLALVKRLVELQGGRVHAESAGIGRGARVIVTLPLALDVQSGARGTPGEIQAA